MNFEDVKKIIVPLLEKSGIQYAGIFGSVARGEAGPNSDVDILIKFQGKPTFDAYLKLDEGLRESLGKDIDLVTEGGVNKFLRPFIEKDLKLVYGQR
jgi:predicted nucleotidyltransferase